MRHHAEPERDKGEDDSSDPARPGRSSQRARQAKRAVTAGGEAKENRHRMYRQRLRAEREERKEKQRDSVAMLAEGERVAKRIKQIGVKEIERVGKSLLVIPPENPGDEVRVARIGHGIAERRDVRPGYRRGKKAETEENECLARNRIAPDPA